MTLSELERNDPLWLKLKAEWEGRLKQLRAQNDDASDALTDRVSARLRGQIAEIKRNIAMGEQKPKVENE